MAIFIIIAAATMICISIDKSAKLIVEAIRATKEADPHG